MSSTWLVILVVVIEVVVVVVALIVVVVVVVIVVVLLVDMVLIEGVDIAKVIEDQVLHYVKYLTRSIDSTGSNGSSGNGSRRHGLLRQRDRIRYFTM